MDKQFVSKYAKISSTQRETRDGDPAGTQLAWALEESLRSEF